MDRERSELAGDIRVALGLALVLGSIWALRDWSSLAALRLPDADDVMRLQQVRDWLGGQAWGDLTQYRLGAGLPMHWSRVADLGPALLIMAAMPLLGGHAAEVLAVVVWPILLFACALALIGRITRRLDAGAARTAMVVAAIAYPATTIFLPGRIDHHGLQLVLLLGATLAATATPTLRNGTILGVLAATSLVVGMETMPLFAVLGAWSLGGWALSSGEGDRRIVGIGIGTLLGLAIGATGFAGWHWRYPACDGFTLQAASGLAIMAIVPLVIAPLGWRARSPRSRLAVVAIVSLIAITLAHWAAPSCEAPYGQVPPLLRRLWLDHVGEAQSVLTAPLATVVGYLGVMLAGIAASVWLVHRHADRNAVLVLALQCAAVAIGAVQLRGAYTGAMLGAPALAVLIDAARRRGTLALVTAWLVSAGMLYPLLAQAVPSTSTGSRAGGPVRDGAPIASACASPAMMATLARLPAGMVMAPIDIAPWGIAATPHRFVAGPYHRNTAGNVAMYRFFLGEPGAARAIAGRWAVRYILYCDGDLGVASAPGSMADLLAKEKIPRWLKPLNEPHASLFAVIGSPTAATPPRPDRAETR